MPSRIDQGGAASRIVLLSLISSLALVAGLLESQFPLPYPGMRLGVANVFSLLALLFFGASEAVMVSALRLALVYFFTGNPFSLACSTGGLILSLPVAIALYRTFGGTLSVPAISVASAAAFNLGQVTAVVLITGERAIFMYLPILLLVSFPTGYVVGFLAEKLEGRLRRLVSIR